MTDLKCRQCSKQIRRTKDNRAFCSISCRMAWHNSMRREGIKFWQEQQQQAESNSNMPSERLETERKRASG